jgi:hypothetical protein
MPIQRMITLLTIPQEELWRQSDPDKAVQTLIGQQGKIAAGQAFFAGT